MGAGRAAVWPAGRGVGETVGDGGRGAGVICADPRVGTTVETDVFDGIGDVDGKAPTLVVEAGGGVSVRPGTGDDA